MVNNFLYAMKHSYSLMETQVNEILQKSSYTNEDENKLFYVVGNCLHTTLDYAERVGKMINEEDKNKLDAFKYANNGLKHGLKIQKLTEPKGGLTFPIQFPLCIETREIVWNIEQDKQSKHQREMYLKYLAGKNVISTCREFIDQLKSYSIESVGD